MCRIIIIIILFIFPNLVLGQTLTGGATLKSNFVFPVNQVATACRTPQGGGSTNLQSMSKTRHYARYNISGNLQIEYPNWFLNYTSNNVEDGPGGTATISASIEYPIGVTLTQVKWAGSATHTITSGNEGSLSDVINVTIPAGQAFYVKTYVNSASSTVFEIQNSGTGTAILDTSNGEEFHAAISGLTDQTLVLGPITGGSTITGRRFGPIAIVAPTSNASIIIVGDSRVYGINDVFTGTSGDKGELERPLGPYYGYTNLSQPGQSLANFISSHTNQVALINKYYSQVVVEIGINDIIVGALTPAQISTEYATVLGYFHIAAYTIAMPPKSSSTDSWATIANQTTSNNVTRISVNTTNLTPRSGYFGCININSIAEDAGLAGKWIVNGTPNYATSDGLHESQTMNLLYVSSGIITSTTFLRYPIYP